MSFFGPPNPANLAAKADIKGLESLGLLAGAPNPFSRGTRLTFTLAHPGPVSLRVFDVRGSEVRTLVRDTRGAGAHTVSSFLEQVRQDAPPAGVILDQQHALRHQTGSALAT